MHAPTHGFPIVAKTSKLGNKYVRVVDSDFSNDGFWEEIVVIGKIVPHGGEQPRRHVLLALLSGHDRVVYGSKAFQGAVNEVMAMANLVAVFVANSAEELISKDEFMLICHRVADVCFKKDYAVTEESLRAISVAKKILGW